MEEISDDDFSAYLADDNPLQRHYELDCFAAVERFKKTIHPAIGPYMRNMMIEIFRAAYLEGSADALNAAANAMEMTS